eukprot:GHVR01093133.1.p1 GENE.GHVR01093133.1~~GHVR01093133.1.p1  ORF type:complete len:319 (-),score=95.77 GHVR01093133.1:215-1171(-)
MSPVLQTCELPCMSRIEMSDDNINKNITKNISIKHYKVASKLSKLNACYKIEKQKQYTCNHLNNDTHTHTDGNIKKNKTQFNLIGKECVAEVLLPLEPVCPTGCKNNIKNNNKKYNTGIFECEMIEEVAHSECPPQYIDNGDICIQRSIRPRLWHCGVGCVEGSVEAHHIQSILPPKTKFNSKLPPPQTTDWSQKIHPGACYEWKETRNRMCGKDFILIKERNSCGKLERRLPDPVCDIGRLVDKFKFILKTHLDTDIHTQNKFDTHTDTDTDTDILFNDALCLLSENIYRKVPKCEDNFILVKGTQDDLIYCKQNDL